MFTKKLTELIFFRLYRHFIHHFSVIFNAEILLMKTLKLSVKFSFVQSLKKMMNMLTIMIKNN